MDPLPPDAVIPAGQERAVRAMLAPELSDGWTFVRAEITDREIRGHYRRFPGDDAAALRLTHPAAPGAGVATARFAVRFLASREGDDVRRLRARLLASVRANEGALRWVVPIPAPPPPPVVVAPKPSPPPAKPRPRRGELAHSLSTVVTPCAVDLHEALARDAEASPSTWTLRRALRAVRRGDRAKAHRALDAAAARDPASLATALVSALAYLVLREPTRAVASLDRFLAQGPPPAHAHAARAMRFDAQRRVGWFHEARASLAALRADAPDALPLCVAEAQFHAGLFDDEAAMEAYRRAVALAPDDPEIPLRGALLALRHGDLATARAMRDACDARRRAPELDADRGALDLALDDVAAARARYELRLAERPDDIAARVALGSLHAWRGDATAARAAADDALALAPDDGPARRLRGAARMLEDEPAEALADFEAAARLAPSDPEAAVWLADALLRLGRHDEALDAVERGCNLSVDGSNYVAAQIVKSLILRARGSASWTPDEVVRANLLALAEPVDASVDDHALLLRAHAALRGNRGWTLSRVDARGALRTQEPALGPRIFAKRALLRFALTADRDAALREFARLEASWPAAAEPHNYEGELHLHRGDFDAAQRCFEEALRRYARSRWGFIGMLAVAVMRGRYEEGLGIIREGIAASGPEGPTAFVYRGEALRHLGRLTEARADLTHAVTTTPSRVGAWANLGLIQATEGDREGLDATMAALRERAPGLLADAADAMGLGLDDALRPERAAALFEQILAMLRGNRASSSVTYYTPGGELRTAMTDFSLGDEGALLERIRVALR